MFKVFLVSFVTCCCGVNPNDALLCSVCSDAWKCVTALEKVSLCPPGICWCKVWCWKFAGEVMMSYSSNWFTLLLLCISAPLLFMHQCSIAFVLWSVRSWFKTGRPGNEGLWRMTLPANYGFQNIMPNQNILK